jgi:hypothetical protein
MLDTFSTRLVQIRSRVSRPEEREASKEEVIVDSAIAFEEGLEILWAESTPAPAASGVEASPPLALPLHEASAPEATSHEATRYARYLSRSSADNFLMERPKLRLNTMNVEEPMREMISTPTQSRQR